jgi:hypothetical protein
LTQSKSTGAPVATAFSRGTIVLAKPNYSFEKRQRDLKRKQKQEEKRQRKLAAKQAKDASQEAPGESTDPGPSEARGDTPPGDPQP